MIMYVWRWREKQLKQLRLSTRVLIPCVLARISKIAGRSSEACIRHVAVHMRNFAIYIYVYVYMYICLCIIQCICGCMLVGLVWRKKFKVYVGVYYISYTTYHVLYIIYHI